LPLLLVQAYVVSATQLNLANAASLDLLSYEEQALCSSLRVLPKPYLTIKEMYIRENERRTGLLRRRDARYETNLDFLSPTDSDGTDRRMLKIDVNKSGRIFDFLVTSGMLTLAYDPAAKLSRTGKEGHVNGFALDGISSRPETQEMYTNGFGRERTVNGGPGG